MKSTGIKGLVKRALPFFATFAIALFITSFFVDLSRPRLGRGWHHRQEMQRLRAENEQLRAEIDRIRAENESRELVPMRHPGDIDMKLDLDVPPPPPAPVAPHAHK